MLLTIMFSFRAGLQIHLIFEGASLCCSMLRPSIMILTLLVWTSLSSAHPASSTLTSFPEETSATEALSEEECLKILEDFPEVSIGNKI